MSVIGSQETWYGDDGKDGYDVTSPQGVGLKLGSATRTTGKLSSCSGFLRQCLQKSAGYLDYIICADIIKSILFMHSTAWINHNQIFKHHYLHDSISTRVDFQKGKPFDLPFPHCKQKPPPRRFLMTNLFGPTWPQLRRSCWRSEVWGNENQCAENWKATKW